MCLVCPWWGKNCDSRWLFCGSESFSITFSFECSLAKCLSSQEKVSTEPYYTTDSKTSSMHAVCDYNIHIPIIRGPAGQGDISFCVLESTDHWMLYPAKHTTALISSKKIDACLQTFLRRKYKHDMYCTLLHSCGKLDHMYCPCPFPGLSRLLLWWFSEHRECSYLLWESMIAFL